MNINYGLGWVIHGNNNSFVSHIIKNVFGRDLERKNKIVSHTGWLASFGAYNQYDTENGYFINRILLELKDLIDDINSDYMNSLKIKTPSC